MTEGRRVEGVDAGDDFEQTLEIGEGEEIEIYSNNLCGICDHEGTECQLPEDLRKIAPERRTRWLNNNKNSYADCPNLPQNSSSIV